MIVSPLIESAAKHAFSPSQRVLVLNPKPPLEPGRAYRIIGMLPTESGARIRYRVKADAEVFERIVDEAALEIADHGS